MRTKERWKARSLFSLLLCSNQKRTDGRVVGKEVGNREGVCRIYRIYHSGICSTSQKVGTGPCQSIVAILLYIFESKCPIHLCQTSSFVQSKDLVFSTLVVPSFFVFRGLCFSPVQNYAVAYLAGH